MHEQDKSKVGRRTFLGESAGMVVGGLGCFGTLEGLRAALAVAMAQQKPLLTEESLNAFLAEARSSGLGEGMAKEAVADLDGFLGKHFVVDARCSRALAALPREDTAKINQAIQESLAGQNELRVQVADADLRELSKPRIGLVRETRAGDRGLETQVTTITIGP
jgi:hypothetical protein